MPGTTHGGDGRPERPRWWSSRRVEVRDESMLPTLRPGDRLLVDRAAYRARRPRAGEIVVLVDPEEPARWLVKRVGAVGPEPAPPPPGRAIGPAPTSPDDPLPPGTVYVVSDAPGPTRDSRRFGPVPLDRLVGRVYRRLFPPDRRGEL